MYEGKTALVIGSTSGIGLGIAEAFAAAGANIVRNGFGDSDAIEQLRSGLAARDGVTVRYDGADMSRLDAIEAMMQRAIDEFGKIVSAAPRPGTQAVCPLDPMDAPGAPATDQLV